MMKFSKSIRPVSVLVLIQILLAACGGGEFKNKPGLDIRERKALADELEQSLFEFIIDPWYPLVIDSLNGGYISALQYDWTIAENSQVKALVQQARHVWAACYIYEAYPERKEFLDYAAHGMEFLRDHMWDKEYGGFFIFCNRDGSPDVESINEKRMYGQAFAVYGLSQYYRMSGDPEALQLAKMTFFWMEEHGHDAEYGGYFEFLKRDGSTIATGDTNSTSLWDTPAAGLKDYNSSIHLMEALTELYRIWPDRLVRARLEEMFFLIRDTFVHPDGYLQLFFYPDWKPVTEEDMNDASGEDYWYTPHFTYGHDVETAFLLIETAHILGWGDDEKTKRMAKRLVDHSLESGWDRTAGGFYDAGRASGDEIKIISNRKSWWGQVEGMNALLMMHFEHPEDTTAYYEKFLQSWNHINEYLIDKEYGGWYNYALDTYPDNLKTNKSHIWKTTYHNVRGMINCIRMLRSDSGHTE